MSFGRKRVIFGLSALVAAGAAALPMASGFAFETAETTVAEADGELLAASGISQVAVNPALETAEPTIALNAVNASALQEAAAEAEAIIEAAEVSNEEFEEQQAEQAASINDARDAEFDCLTKVIMHESRGQPRDGQLAVAQTVMNRVESSQFPNTICGVVHQRRQFTNIRSYRPRRSGRAWNTAVELAIDARNGVSAQTAPGALYFHATRVRPAFSRTKTRVARIGDHIFYR